VSRSTLTVKMKKRKGEMTAREEKESQSETTNDHFAAGLKSYIVPEKGAKSNAAFRRSGRGYAGAGKSLRISGGLYTLYP